MGWTLDLHTGGSETIPPAVDVPDDERGSRRFRQHESGIDSAQAHPTISS
jgi:hypothetical protein